MKTSSIPKPNAETRPLFSRSNYILLLVSVLLIVLGLLLMAGPASTPGHYEPDIFSPRRIQLAPLLCLSGYLLVFVAILWRRRGS